MATDEDRLRALRAFDLDDIPDRRSGGESMDHNIGTAMARVVRKVMTTDDSMRPEIEAAKRAVREIDTRIDRKAREYQMKFVRYMTTDEPTQKIETKDE